MKTTSLPVESDSGVWLINVLLLVVWIFLVMFVATGIFMYARSRSGGVSWGQAVLAVGAGGFIGFAIVVFMHHMSAWEEEAGLGVYALLVVGIVLFFMILVGLVAATIIRKNKRIRALEMQIKQQASK